jgi:hypothetical protein
LGLELKIGQQALEIDFLRRCLQHGEEQRKPQGIDFALLVYERIEKEMSLATTLTRWLAGAH